MSANASPLDPQQFFKLRRDLDRIASVGDAQGTPEEHLARVHTGYEFRTDPSYRWHGMRRGGDARHPLAIFQYTVEGVGAFWSPQRGIEQILPGHAFSAIIPSEHEYYLPTGFDGWRFVWLMISHPYVVSRIRKRQSTSSPLWVVPPDSLLAGLVMRLHEAVQTGAFANRFDEERLLLEFLVAYDQFGSELEHPPVERNQMLQAMREEVEANLRRPANVENIAARQGMSRSYFSHRFRRVTGLSPAQYILQVRLAHVANLLTNSKLKLDAVAAETGFATATHLCRVFRRYYHLSPDSFRKQTSRR